MAIKLIVLDLDGTLLKTKFKIQKDNLKAIARVYQEKPEVKIVIATGRAPISTIMHAKTCQIHEKAGHMICYNGGSVIDIIADEQKILFKKSLTIEQSQKVFKFAQDNNIKFWGYAVDNQTAYINKHSFKIWVMEHFNKLKVHKINDVKDLGALYKVLLFCKNKDEVKEIIAKLELNPDLELATSSHSVIEVNPLGVNKAAAVQFLCEKWNIKPEEVLACGDAMNDYKLIKWVKYGIAMENAHPNLKEIAYFVSDTNKNGGVAKAINKFLFPANELEVDNQELKKEEAN